MSISVSKHSGFCFGVENAVNTAIKLNKECCTLGELIHNTSVIKDLEKRGIKAVKSPNEVDKDIVIIRSHGVAPEVLEQLQNIGKDIIDCTCSFVKRSQNIVKEYSDKGYKIVIVGEKSHPETIGIAGNAKIPPIIIDNSLCIPEFDENDKVCVVVQTTFSAEKFDKIAVDIKNSSAKIVEIFNTICYTTTIRQQECLELSKKSQLMVVVGDKKSANTNELFEICKNNCANVIFCQSVDDIKDIDVSNLENIGIVAGASTPKELVKEVKLTMEEKMQDLQPETEVIDTKAEVTGNDISMEDVMSSLEKKKNFKRGQIIECTIESVGDDGLHLSIPLAKTEVLLPKEEACLNEAYDKNAFTVGEKIKVKVLSNDNKLVISRKAIEDELKVDEGVQELIDGKIFTMTFHSKNKGGLRGKMGTYNVFVPGSQIKLGFVNEKDFDKYIGKPLTLKVVKAEGKDLVASAKVILEEEKKNKEDSFWSKIIVGEVVSGKVMRFTNFGAFVSVEGFDCLAHISDLSWENVKSCDEVLTIGETYDFKVLKAERETNKVSLGFKQLQKRPIDIIAEKYPDGSIVKGKVTRLKAFGAFVELEPNVEGLVHISQVSHTYVDNIAHALQEGEEVDVKVIGIDKDKNKINLSIKALLPEPEKPVREEKPEKEKRPRKSNNVEREKRDDELTNWVTGDGGTSIADLLAKMEKDN